MLKRGLTIAAFGTCVLSACGDSPDGAKKPEVAVPSASSAASAPVKADAEREKELVAAQAKQIKPETLVRFPDSSIACLSKDALQEVMTYGANGQATKMQAMMLNKANPDGQCIMLAPKARYKVISAEYNVADMPEMGLLEIVAEKATSKNGAWTVSWVAEPVENR